MERKGNLETTLGNLIVALTEETPPFCRDEKEAYHVVAFALVDLLYVGSRGNRRTLTMRAFTEEEADRIIGGLPPS